MTSSELREQFLNFFQKEEHKVVPSSSLIPADPSVLFTTAGMQQFKPYYLGEKSPYGERVASCQKCFRTSDIEVVGDESHLTFLEMLGNFSFAASAEASSEGGEGYFKADAIKWAYEFLFKELKLPLGNAIFTVFEGDRDIPEDKESAEIWGKLGTKEHQIKKCGRKDNFWGPTGEEGPCGPTTEIYVNGIEVWNLVFNEYFQDKSGKLTPLKQKGVDTGMGLERLAMIVQKKSNVFETDLFLPLIKEISSKLKAQNSKLDEKSVRIISDHIKSTVFLISEGILPSNVERGYVLRRVLRRAITYGKALNLPDNFLIPLAKIVIEIYKDIYQEIKSKETDILTIIQNEEEGFEKSEKPREKIAKKMIAEKQSSGTISGGTVYNIYSSTSVVADRIEQLAEEQGIRVIKKEEFEEGLKKHQEISRAGAKKKFGGGGEFSPKLHTATHLLHAALREVLGKHVKQMGSDITSQRLRFDFYHPRKMTDGELKKVEELVNQKIREDLEVKKEEMNYGAAINGGALAFFKEKYPEKVSVFSIGVFSKEICAGPHVKKTSELGNFNIIKEESSGAGIRRIRAILK